MPSLLQHVNSSKVLLTKQKDHGAAGQGAASASRTSEERGEGSLASAMLGLLPAGHWSPGPGLPKTTALSLCPSLKEERRNQTSLQLPGSSFNFIRIPRLSCRLCFDRSQDQEIQARGTSWAVNSLWSLS